MTVCKDKDAEMKERQETPHLWNLNPDPQLTGMIIQMIKPGQRQHQNKAYEQSLSCFFSDWCEKQRHVLAKLGLCHPSFVYISPLQFIPPYPHPPNHRNSMLHFMQK